MVSDTRDSPSPSYPGQSNFSLISLQNSTNRLHKDREPVSEGVGEGGLGRGKDISLGELSRLGW